MAFGFYSGVWNWLLVSIVVLGIVFCSYISGRAVGACLVSRLTVSAQWAHVLALVAPLSAYVARTGSVFGSVSTVVHGQPKAGVHGLTGSLGSFLPFHLFTF